MSSKEHKNHIQHCVYTVLIGLHILQVASYPDNEINVQLLKYVISTCARCSDMAVAITHVLSWRHLA